MQPVFTSASAAAATTRTTRRGGVVNYADPGSGDEFPDAGALDSDDSDFIASGGTRTAVRGSMRMSSRAPAGSGIFTPGGAPMYLQSVGQGQGQQSALPREDLDQSYLGRVPPAKFISPRPAQPTQHTYPWVYRDTWNPARTNLAAVDSPPELLENQARKATSLVPIRVEFETDTHRIRDCFVWNLNEDLIEPEMFARTFCADLDLPENPWAETVATQIRAQLEDHEGVGSMDLGIDSLELRPDEEIPECRVILSVRPLPLHC